MTSPVFDDARLDDPRALLEADELLRYTASAGARLRKELAEVDQTLLGLEPQQPRAVVSIGPESRLIRAVLEPTCPVPFVAWPTNNLPQWVGPLDVVIALDTHLGVSELAESVAEAERRGALIVAVTRPRSPLALAAGKSGVLLPVTTGDQQVAAILAMMALHAMGLGPSINVDAVARAADDVAEMCGPRIDLAVNPAKVAAMALADSAPLIWGGSVLAARASRRVAEALRGITGMMAIAADAEAISPILDSTPLRDVFADPAEDDSTRPTLLLLAEGELDEQGRRLRHLAESHDVRCHVVAARSDGLVERYIELLTLGNFLAAYSGIGVGRFDLPAEEF